jgi:hypothetical protein
MNSHNNNNRPQKVNPQGYPPPIPNHPNFQQQQPPHFYNQQFQYGHVYPQQTFPSMGQQNYQAFVSRPPPPAPATVPSNANYFNPSYLNNLPMAHFQQVANFPVQNCPPYYNRSDQNFQIK